MGRDSGGPEYENGFCSQIFVAKKRQNASDFASWGKPVVFVSLFIGRNVLLSRSPRSIMKVSVGSIPPCFESGRFGGLGTSGGLLRIEVLTFEQSTPDVNSHAQTWPSLWKPE